MYMHYLCVCLGASFGSRLLFACLSGRGIRNISTADKIGCGTVKKCAIFSDFKRIFVQAHTQAAPLSFRFGKRCWHTAICFHAWKYATAIMRKYYSSRQIENHSNAMADWWLWILHATLHLRTYVYFEQQIIAMNLFFLKIWRFQSIWFHRQIVRSSRKERILWKGIRQKGTTRRKVLIYVCNRRDNM